LLPVAPSLARVLLLLLLLSLLFRACLMRTRGPSMLLC
jgi:hypothetical protein